MRTPLKLLCIIFLTPLGSMVAAFTTNADIEKMLAAELGEEVILNAITSRESQFDTSADALISLKQKAASPAILAAITKAKSPPQNQAAAKNFLTTGSAEDVVLVDGESRTSI